MNWLRYVLLAVCILSALAGYRKGLVRTVLSMVSLILVTGLAIWMNPYVTDVLNERTTLPQYVEKKCLETFENNEFLSGEDQAVPPPRQPLRCSAASFWNPRLRLQRRPRPQPLPRGRV